MKKTPRKPRRGHDKLRSEYQVDYSRSRSNRFAEKLGPRTIAVVLEPDVAKVFGSTRSVNKVLRSVIDAVPPAVRVPRGGRRKAG